MKILYLSDANFPSQAANSVHVMKMCEAFGDLSHTVMLTGFRRNAATDDELCLHYGVRRNFVFGLNRIPPLKGALFFHAAVNLWRAWRFKPDVIIGRSFISVALVSLFFDKPVIFETHSPYAVLSGIQERAFRVILKKASFLIVISAALRAILSNEMEQLKLSHPPIHVHHDGATTAEERSSTPLPGSRLKVGYVGTVHAGRGIELLIRLSAMLPDVEFHIVGGSVEDIRTRLQTAALPDNFFCHGYKTPRESNGLRNAFDVVVAPYQKATQVRSGAYTSDYMSPLKIFEYMSAAKPIIASDLPVIREVLNDENSVLVKADDLEAWREAVISLNSTQLRAKLGLAAFQDFERNYTWKARTEKILSQLAFNQRKNETSIII